MNIVKIDGNNVYKTSLAPGIDVKEFLANNKDYIETDIIIDSNNVYIFKNEKVVIDFEATKERKIISNKEKAKILLAKTDFTLLQDNPLDLSADEVMSLIEFRKLMRIVSDEFPIIPEFLITKKVI